MTVLFNVENLTRKSYKVTDSHDDGFVEGRGLHAKKSKKSQVLPRQAGALRMTILWELRGKDILKLALMGVWPGGCEYDKVEDDGLVVFGK